MVEIFKYRSPEISKILAKSRRKVRLNRWRNLVRMVLTLDDSIDSGVKHDIVGVGN